MAKSRRKSKAVAVIPAAEVVEAKPDRTLGEIIAQARKVVDAKKAKANAWPPVVYDPEISAFEAELMFGADPGSEFDRITNGWRVKLVDAGVTMLGSGPTILDAILSHGQQIDPVAEAAAARAKSEAALAAIGQEPSVPPETKAEKKARIAAENKAAREG